MFKTARWTLRQRRYRGLAALMVPVALLCIGAGTFEVTRFQQKVHENAALGDNAHAAPIPLTPALDPLVGHGTASSYAFRFRTVTASGQYTGTSQFVRDQSIDGTNGFYVLNPLRTSTGVLLVVRGFVAAAEGAPPPAVSAPPSGLTHIVGRLETGATNDDGAHELSDGQLESINPTAQAARLQAPVYNGYLTLSAGQPGTSGLQALPPPDLSNPAGGAYAWQDFSYILQWYLFALFALAAPFAVSRYEARAARQRFFGLDDDELVPLEPAPRQELTASAASGADVAVRRSSALVAQSPPWAGRWQQATHLADRYGLTLGPEGSGPTDALAPVDPAGYPEAVRRDPYKDSYNDYLWQLALADGSTPQVDASPVDASPVDASPVEPSPPDAIAAQSPDPTAGLPPEPRDEPN